MRVSGGGPNAAAISGPGLLLHAQLIDRVVPNNSHGFDAYEWNTDATVLETLRATPASSASTFERFVATTSNSDGPSASNRLRVPDGHS